MSDKTTPSKPTKRRAANPRPSARAAEARRPKRPASTSKPAAKPAAKSAPAKAASKTAGSAGAGIKGLASKASSFDASGFAARHRVPLIVAGIVIALVVVLYGPARGLYCAWRENGTLRGTLEQENQTTEEYQSDVDSLLSEEGIKDEARKKGYVGEGEKSIVVDGEPSEEEAPSDEEPAEDEMPWYLSMTDFIFQYSEETEE